MKILLFSHSKDVFEATKQITEGSFELIWYNYDVLREDSCPPADIVIMHFDKKGIKKGTFEPIIQVKGRLGHTVPILAVIEGGTPQEILSVLRAGAYDYIETVEKLQEYKKKIEDIVLWDWYQKKYGFYKGQ